MDIKKLVIGSVAAGVALVVVGYILSMVQFLGVEGGDMGMWTMWVGAILHGLVLVVVLGWAGAGDMMSGAKAGALYGVLVSVASSVHGSAGALDVGALIGGAIGAAILKGAAGAALGMLAGRGD